MEITFLKTYLFCFRPITKLLLQGLTDNDHLIKLSKQTTVLWPWHLTTVFFKLKKKQCNYLPYPVNIYYTLESYLEPGWILLFPSSQSLPLHDVPLSVYKEYLKGHLHNQIFPSKRLQTWPVFETSNNNIIPMCSNYHEVTTKNIKTLD